MVLTAVALLVALPASKAYTVSRIKGMAYLRRHPTISILHLRQMWVLSATKVTNNQRLAGMVLSAGVLPATDVLALLSLQKASSSIQTQALALMVMCLMCSPDLQLGSLAKVKATVTNKLINRVQVMIQSVGTATLPRSRADQVLLLVNRVAVLALLPTTCKAKRVFRRLRARAGKVSKRTGGIRTT